MTNFNIDELTLEDKFNIGELTPEEYREETGNILTPWQEYRALEQTSIDEAAEANSLNGL